MRKPQHSQVNRSGIRAGVWLAALSGLLLCVLSSLVFPRQPRVSAREPAFENHSQPAASSPRRKTPRVSQIRFTPAHPEEGGDYLDAAQLAMIEQLTQDRRTWVDAIYFDIR